ncbi:MAG: hypothetical protein KF830_15370 [Planctomycetes bacterium]|nr:hypothetical protein [Planctomycetota bacterium]
MRFQLGILACLLAGCVGQPTAFDPTPTGAAGLALAALPAHGAFVLRIGIEHLPPDEAGAQDVPPRIEGRPRPLRPPPAAPTRSDRRREPDAAHRHTWSLSSQDFASFDDPIARETLRFVQDLVDTDLERSRREVTLPILGMQDRDPLSGPLLDSEQALLAAQDEWLQRQGPSLMRRPLRQMLRRLPFVRQVQVEFDDFRSDNLPLTEPYRQHHDERRSLGRMSLRVRTDSLRDPVEVAYVLAGVRLGTSQTFARLSIDWDLGDRLRFEVRARADYHGDQRSLRANLAYRHSPTTSLHLSVGDDMDFLSTASPYSLFETPMDGSPGLVLYAVHLF